MIILFLSSCDKIYIFLPSWRRHLFDFSFLGVILVSAIKILVGIQSYPSSAAAEASHHSLVPQL